MIHCDVLRKWSPMSKLSLRIICRSTSRQQTHNVAFFVTLIAHGLPIGALLLLLDLSDNDWRD
jgi:hypothetical protein